MTMSKRMRAAIDKEIAAASPESRAVLERARAAMERLKVAGEEELQAFQRLGDAIELALDAELHIIGWPLEYADIVAILKMRREGEAYAAWHRRYIRTGEWPRYLWEHYSRAKRWRERRR